MQVSNSSNLKLFRGSASYHPFSIWRDHTVRSAPSHATFPSCWIPGFLCPSHGVKREPIKRLKDLGCAAQGGMRFMRWGNRSTNRKIHSKGTFSSNAYFLCDWFVWGRLRKSNSLAFPSTSLLFQGLNVPNCTIQADSLRLVLREAPHSTQQCSFQRLLSVTFSLSIDSRITLKWKIYPPPSRNWGHWYSGKVLSCTRVILQLFVNLVQWLIVKCSPRVTPSRHGLGQTTLCALTQTCICNE